MNTFLLTVAAIIVAVLTALIAIPPLVDWNAYRGVFEEEASRIFGREVRVGGNVVLRILPQPYLRFEKVRVAEAPGVTGEPFLRADSFTIQLSVPPLLRGVIEARKVSLERPRVRLRIDEDGRGSWQDLRFHNRTSMFAPKDVALKEVDISSGQITFEGPSREVIGRISDVSGQLSSAALRGPYKFVGDIRWRGALHELRLSTGTFNDNEAVPAKIVLRSREGSGSVAINGLIQQAEGQPPELTGTITAKMTLAPPPDRAKPAQGEGPVEARAELKLNPKAFALEKILVSFNQGGRPQLLTGQASAAMTKNPTLRLSLQSRWLDLDRLSGVSSARGPLPVINALARQLADLQPALFARTNLNLQIDQATVAKSSIGSLIVSASSHGRKLDVENVSAVLPGGAQLHLDGTFSRVPSEASTQDGAGAVPAEPPLTFDGYVLVKGTNAARFAGWIGQGVVPAQGVQAVPFDVRGHLRADHGRVALTKLAAKIGAARFFGAIGYRNGNAAKLSVLLRGTKVDLASLKPDALSLANLKRVLGLAKPRSGEPQQLTALEVKVDAGAVSDANVTYRNVKFDLLRQNGVLRLRKLELSDPSGLVLVANGRGANRAPGEASNGNRVTLAGTVSIPSRAARVRLETILQDLAEVDAKPLLARLPAPAVLAYRFAQPAQASAATTLALDGRVRDGRLIASLETTGPLNALSKNAGAVKLTLTSRSAQSVFNIVRWAGAASELQAQSMPANDAKGPGDDGASPANSVRFDLVSRGVPNVAMVTDAQLRADGTAIRYQGRVKLSGGEKSEVLLGGEMTVSAKDLRGLAKAAGVAFSEQLPMLPLALRTDLSGPMRKLVMQIPRGRLGTHEFAGRITRNVEADGGATLFSGVIRTKSLVVPDLVGLLTDGRGSAPGEPGEDSEQPTIAALWPNARFRPEVLRAFQVDLKVAAQSVVLAQGVALSDATFTLKGTKSGLTIADLRAAGPRGGTVSGAIALKTDGVGIALSGNVQADGVPIADSRASPAGKATAATGQASVTATFSGRGLSPRALVTVLSGKGSVTLTKSRIAGLDPGVVSSAAATFIVDPEIAMADLPNAIKTLLAQRSANLPARKIPMSIQDGAVRLGAIIVKTANGRLENKTTVDLARMAFDSTWRLVPRAPQHAQERALPAVELVTVGSLANISNAPSRIEADALSREIVVRRLEGNVAELERLRREDQLRAEREAERRRQQQLQQQQQPVAPNRAAPSPGGPQGNDERGRPGTVPKLVAPPVLRVPLPLPTEPKQRSQVPSGRKVAAKRERSAEEVRREIEMRRRFGLMRLGTPFGPYDPNDARSRRDVEKWRKRSGIVDRGKLVAPRPKLLVPFGLVAGVTRPEAKIEAPAPKLITPDVRKLFEGPQSPGPSPAPSAVAPTFRAPTTSREPRSSRRERTRRARQANRPRQRRRARRSASWKLRAFGWNQ